MFDERILRVAADGGTSVLVGSADANAVPACCRGIAVSTDGSALTRATVYVPVATSRDVVANAATTKKLAVMITRVVEHVGVQFKGTVMPAAEPSPTTSTTTASSSTANT